MSAVVRPPSMSLNESMILYVVFHCCSTAVPPLFHFRPPPGSDRGSSFLHHRCTSFFLRQRPPRTVDSRPSSVLYEAASYYSDRSGTFGRGRVRTMPSLSSGSIQSLARHQSVGQWRACLPPFHLMLSWLLKEGVYDGYAVD